VLAVGTRLSDFTTGSHSLFPQARLVNLNVNAFDARKWRGVELVADAKLGLDALSAALPSWRSESGWRDRARRAADDWRMDIARLTSQRDVELPYDGDVIGAVPNCTSCGGRACPAAITWNTAIRAWATRSPAAWASRWPGPTAR
jgi:3D-(3,5/4)-trihydroxycyclohexane-1,2-dione acylhydrolase (decyclizing)